MRRDDCRSERKSQCLLSEDGETSDKLEKAVECCRQTVY